MGQHSLGIFIAFTAMDHVSVKTESVKEAFGFLIGLLNKLLAQCFKSLELAALNFEIGHDGTTSVLGRHRFLLGWGYASIETVEKPASSEADGKCPSRRLCCGTKSRGITAKERHLREAYIEVRCSDKG
jgi:hypothetical protein